MGCCLRYWMGLSEASINNQPKCYFFLLCSLLQIFFLLEVSPAPAFSVSLMSIAGCCNSPAISLRNASPFSGRL